MNLYYCVCETERQITTMRVESESLPIANSVFYGKREFRFKYFATHEMAKIYSNFLNYQSF